VYGVKAGDKSTVRRWSSRIAGSEKSQSKLSEARRSGRPTTEDAEAVVLVEIMPRGQTINSYLYIQTLQTRGAFLEELTSQKCFWNPPWTGKRTTTHKFQRHGKNHVILPRPTHSPDHAPSDLQYPFEAPKDAIRRQKCGSDDDVVVEVAASTKFKLV